MEKVEKCVPFFIIIIVNNYTPAFLTISISSLITSDLELSIGIGMLSFSTSSSSSSSEEDSDDSLKSPFGMS